MSESQFAIDIAGEQQLVEFIGSARERLVVIAPAVTLPVAESSVRSGTSCGTTSRLSWTRIPKCIAWVTAMRRL